MKKPKTEEYYITARLALEVNIAITASSLEDAVEKSKSLNVENFVEILGDYNDGEMRITGIFEHYNPIKL